MTRLVNNPDNFPSQAVAGLVSAFPNHLRPVFGELFAPPVPIARLPSSSVGDRDITRPLQVGSVLASLMVLCAGTSSPLPRPPRLMQCAKPLIVAPGSSLDSATTPGTSCTLGKQQSGFVARGSTRVACSLLTTLLRRRTISSVGELLATCRSSRSQRRPVRRAGTLTRSSRYLTGLTIALGPRSGLCRLHFAGSRRASIPSRGRPDGRGHGDPR